MEKILTVDEKDRVTGEMEKTACHLGEGVLHRAFLLMVFNEEGRLLLARRSAGKMLWPGYWDGTVASHLHRGETYEQAASARLKHELGIEAPSVKFLFKFIYHAQYKNIGSEREVCGVLSTVIPGDCPLNPDPDEVSGCIFVDPEDAAGMEDVAPWLVLALEHMGRIKESGGFNGRNVVL